MSQTKLYLTVPIVDSRVEKVFISLYSEIPAYYTLVNYIKQNPNEFANFTGRVLVDDGYRMGNDINRFAQYNVRHGIVDRKSVTRQHFSPQDPLLHAIYAVIRQNLQKYDPYCTNFSVTQLKLIKAGVIL